MVAVVTSEVHDFVGTVAQMHRDRKPVFADSPADEYDTATTVYLVAQDPGSGAQLGSVRLVGTAGAHPLGDKFGFLCAGPVPRGLETWEITRLCTAPGLDIPAALAIRLQLAVGIMEYALANGIARYTIMTQLAHLPTLLAVGWDIEPLGLPVPVAGEMLAALQITVSATSLERLRALHGFERTVLEAPRHASGQVA